MKQDPQFSFVYPTIELAPVQSLLAALDYETRIDLVNGVLPLYDLLRPMMRRFADHRGQAQVGLMGRWQLGRFTYWFELARFTLILIDFEIDAPPDPDGDLAAGHFFVSLRERVRWLGLRTVRRTAAQSELIAHGAAFAASRPLMPAPVAPATPAAETVARVGADCRVRPPAKWLLALVSEDIRGFPTGDDRLRFLRLRGEVRERVLAALAFWPEPLTGVFAIQRNIRLETTPTCDRLDRVRVAIDTDWRLLGEHCERRPACSIGVNSSEVVGDDIAVTEVRRIAIGMRRVAIFAGWRAPAALGQVTLETGRAATGMVVLLGPREPCPDAVASVELSDSC